MDLPAPPSYHEAANFRSPGDKDIPLAQLAESENVDVVVDAEGNSSTVQRRPESRRQVSMGCDDVSKGSLTIVGIIVAIIAILLVILLPMSFSTLEFHEYGFMRRKSTGSVSTDRVYASGRHAIGPDYEFKTFPADAHFESYHQVTVFAADRLQVSITAHMQYFLRRDQLPYLHKNFDIQYRPVLRNNALDALKGAATLFTTREYIRERMKVEEALFKAVKERLGGKCCEKDCRKLRTCTPGCLPYGQCKETDFGLFATVRYFQLTELHIPSDLEERYLRALVLQEETEAEKFRQDAQIVRKETEARVKKIGNEAAEIAETANSQSSLIGTTARANATAIVERARTEGLKNLYSEVGLTSSQHKNSFDYLRTMMEKKEISLAIDYQTLVAGSWGRQ